MRPPKKIILSNEVKTFIKKNRHIKKPIHIALIGRKVSKEEWKAEGMIRVQYDTVCPQNSKPLKGITQGKEKVLGLVHSHPDLPCIPSTVDLRKHPVNKLCFLVGKDSPSFWFKHKNGLVEVFVE